MIGNCGQLVQRPEAHIVVVDGIVRLVPCRCEAALHVSITEFSPQCVRKNIIPIHLGTTMRRENGNIKRIRIGILQFQQDS